MTQCPGQLRGRELHVVIDDHSRYLYVEQHDHEDAETNADTPQRAIVHFIELGLRTRRR